MRVALICAVSSHPAYRAADEKVDPPLGVLSLATLLRDRHQVRIFDGELRTCRPETMADEVLAWGPDVIGFSLNFSTRARASAEMAAHMRARAPGLPIVFGGNHATFDWQRLVERPFVDYVVLHEAERSFPELLDHLEDPTRRLPTGLVRLDDAGRVDYRPFTQYVEDLDELPAPDFDLFDDPAAYSKAITSSRGCPYTCIYCSTQQMWRRWRCRSAPLVVAEMLDLAERYQAERVLFADDTFMVRKDRALDICDRLIAAGSPVKWGFSTRIETVPDDAIPLLARAGCRWIFFGVESGSDRILREMKRRYTSKEALEKIRRCAECGITITASFIVGLPWETRADVQQTFELMRAVDTHRVLLNIFTPLHGTDSYVSPEDYGIRMHPGHDPELKVVGHGQVDYALAHLTTQDIKDLWLEGQGIVMSRGRERNAIERKIERNRYGLMG